MKRFTDMVYLSMLVLLMFSGVESNIDTDKEALLSIKSQLSAESSDPLLSWDKNTFPCNWTGVLCDNSSTRVEGLDLSGLRLTGSISPYVGNLSFLYSLQVQGNSLAGSFPDQIGNLFRLRVLNMSYNSFVGALPHNISNLAELTVLDLTANKLSGRLPTDLSQLTKLQVINLGQNSLSGPIPPSIANVSSLIRLNLGTNLLSGEIPSDLSQLRNLQVLNLVINNLTGTIPPSLYNMTSLVSLALASNQLWGEIPYNVGDTLPNLLVFNFCINKFTGTIPGSLHNLTNIQVIRMAENFLEGTVPPGLGNLPYLTMYNIGFNRIVSSGDNGLEFLTSLKNSTRLDFLAIDGNLLEGVIPESVGNLSKSLSKFYMGGNRIYGRIPASIGQLTGLSLFNVSYNSINGSIPPEIGQLTELQELGLAGNQLSGNIPDSLGSLRKVNQIDLSGNQLVGQIPTSFGNFGNLISMDLSNNRLNGSVPTEVLSLSSLSTILNLSRNLLSGPLNEQVGALDNIVTIDLSNNHLSGDIPSSIKDCRSLERLFLAKNEFSGPIPNTLGEVKGLEVLDLSYNKLSGSIPTDLQDLHVLQSVNLSFNNLEGVIPSGGVFRNLSEVKLEGNPRLCSSSGCDGSPRPRKLVVIVCITVSIIAFALCVIVVSFVFVRKHKRNISGTPDLLKADHQTISYHELRRATDNFNPANLVGKGSFGSVYKGYLGEGIAVAIKILDIKTTGSWKSFVAECEALRNVRHRNLVKLITSCSSLDSKNNDFLALVYDFLGNGSLEDWLRGKRTKPNGDGLSMTERLNVAIDVASVLNYLHDDIEVPVVHCDLKPSNILLDEDMTAKVGDFGLAKLLVNRTNIQHSISSTYALKGSIGYIPPEYGIGQKPSKAGDVYSFGVMLLELFTGKSPVDDCFMGDLNLIESVRSVFPHKILQALDPELLQYMDDPSDDNKHINLEIQHECMNKLFGVGLSCTADSPDSRISMRDAVRELKSVKRILLCD
ncbi:putative Serine-threonine protein kinase plant-type [Tripterygium wilfordii]|uniref:non-specific serine/threonine protein kinase n=1 Tax=Tripterygium wilfordii TaxID=458696 RepID=A0A7J7D2R4_TRIWF|nr:putative receptor-like protein kinase At3g47110 [Tripterygium wilfordii]KAF5740634.1 putative Serine-threonine protein kinase plant-type [Tripterygium wilfordii]